MDYRQYENRFLIAKPLRFSWKFFLNATSILLLTSQWTKLLKNESSGRVKSGNCRPSKLCVVLRIETSNTQFGGHTPKCSIGCVDDRAVSIVVRTAQSTCCRGRAFRQSAHITDRACAALVAPRLCLRLRAAVRDLRIVTSRTLTLLQSQDISHGPVPIVAQLGERARPYCCSCGVGSIVLSHSADSTTLLLLCRSGRRFIQCYATGGHCNRFEPVSKSRPLHQRHNQFTNYYRYDPNLLSRQFCKEQRLAIGLLLNERSRALLLTRKRKLVHRLLYQEHYCLIK